MNLIRRALRRGVSEEGFTLIEMITAMFILSIAVVGLAQLTGSMLVSTLRTRQRETGVAMANRIIEEVRSNGYANVKMKSGPATYTDDNETTYNTIIDAACTTCLTYSQSVTEGDFTFTVLSVVFGVDDSADGLAGSDTDAQTIDYKRVVVKVSTASGAPFTYKADTIVHDTQADPVVPVQGITVEIRDPDNGNAIVNEEGFDWRISVTGAGVVLDEVDEGIYNNFDLQQGSYTCVLENTIGSKDWHPQGSPTANSESFSCTVSDGTVNIYARSWVQAIECLVGGGLTGDLWIGVQNQAGDPITNASVDPAPTGGQGNPSAKTVGSNGEVVFQDVDQGPYDVVVTASGYQSATATACVTANEPDAPQATVTLIPPPPSGTTATVNVSVTYTGKGTHTYRVALEGGPQPYNLDKSISKNQTVVFSFTVVFGTYDVRLYCQKKKDFNLKSSLLAQAFNQVTPAYTRSFSVADC